LVPVGHGHAIDEDRNDARAVLERGADLESHVVVGIVEPRAAFRVADREPPGSDQGDKDAAGLQCCLDGLDEVGARLDGVQVHEHGSARQVMAEPDLQEARVGAGVAAAVADEDAMGGRRYHVPDDHLHALLRSLRYQGERGFALMSQRWRTLQRVMLSPGKIGDIAKAVLVLVLFEHKMLT
jgi:hypothetical protein